MPFDSGGGEDGKREGMRRVDEAANEEWKRAADMAILAEARRRPTLTTDHVWDHLKEHYPNHYTPERRAMGPRMTAAAKAGTLKRRYETAKSAMSVCNSRDKNVWNSNIYEGPGPRMRARKPFDKSQFGWF